MKLLLQVILSLCITTIVVVFADVHELLLKETSTSRLPPKPYIFSYSAGRASGHIDRTHTEVSDGNGTVYGKFSYIDPKQQVRTVAYVADEYGFHPQLSHPHPQDTRANIEATAKHFALYNKIAQTHQNIDPSIVSPQDTESVAHAKNKHYDLFEKISAEHARIATEREAQRLAFEATSEVNHIEGDQLSIKH